MEIPKKHYCDVNNFELITLKSLNVVKKEEKDVEKETYLYMICLYIKYCAVYVYYLNFHCQKYLKRFILTKNGI